MEKRLDKKRLISKFMTSQPGEKKQLKFTYCAMFQEVKAIIL